MTDEQPDIGAMIQRAAEAARRSPCAKSKRGVVIFAGDEVVAEGCNAPPPGFECTGTEACRVACNKVCVHAEQAAILALIDKPRPRAPLHMLHVKVVDGVPVPSGSPSCWQCSRLILQAGIRGMWLLHHAGPKVYGTRDFHCLTLMHHGLPESQVYTPPPAIEVAAVAGAFLAELGHTLRAEGHDEAADALREATERRFATFRVGGDDSEGA